MLRPLTYTDISNVKTPPYHPDTRPWYLDIFWRHFLGRPYAENGRDGFTGTQGTAAVTTLASQASVGTQTLVCTTGGVAAAGFVVGQVIVVGSTSGNMRTHVITAISTDTLTVSPKVDVTMAAGSTVQFAWGNSTHPGNTLAYAALAQKIAYTRRSEVVGGPDVLAGVGLMVTPHTDENGEDNVPTGWQSGTGGSSGTSVWAATAGASEIAFTATSWANTGLSFARDSTGIFFSSNTTIGNGMRTLTAIPVKPGQTYTLTWAAAMTQGRGSVFVVDAAAPSTLVASLALMGDDSANLARHTGALHTNGITFRVPYGTSTLEIRVQSAATNSQLYLAEMRMFEARQDAAYDRYVIEDPGERGILICGDSWAIPANMGNALRTQLETRFGRTINWFNTAVSGERLDQTNARFATEVKPVNPRYCIVQSFTNDLAAGRSSSTIQGDLDTFVENCRSNGIIPIVTGAGALSSSSSSITLSTSRQVNDDLRGRCDRFAM